MRSLALLLASGCASAAWSQVAVPPGVAPGQIQRSLETLPEPRARPAVVPDVTSQELPAGQAADLRFVLRSVEVEGAHVYSSEELTRPFAHLLGKETNVAQVFEMARSLSARYRSDGYVLSQVIVPPQTIADGHVRLVAIEGYIDAVRLRGNAHQDEVLQARARDLEAARPLTSAVLERELLLLNDLGQTSARGTLVPSAAASGAADLIVDFARERAAVTIGTSNRNSRSLGPRRVTLDAEWFGAFGVWDRVSLHAGSTLDDELNYAGLGYGGLLGRSGAQWTVGVTGVRARPGAAANLAATDLATDSLSATLQLTYPLVRSRSRNLYLRGAMTTFDGQSEVLLTQLSDDRLRTVRVGITVDTADRWRGINMVDLELSRGLDAFGARMAGTAETPLSRVNGRADFSKATLYAARLQSLGGDWSALLAFSAQHAFTTLLAPEMFSFGGELFGRGYDSAELVGDDGIAAKLELRYAMPLPQLSGVATPYAFLDWGQVERRHPINETAYEQASSWGVGVRFSGSLARVQSFVEFGEPIDHDVAAAGNRDSRIFAGLQISL
jgi:hemolysin activation/secretion protein